jgi:hypothetical protein
MASKASAILTQGKKNCCDLALTGVLMLICLRCCCPLPTQRLLEPRDTFPSSHNAATVTQGIYKTISY